MRSTRSFLLSAAFWFGAVLAAQGIDYSVPFVRNGLSYTGWDGTYVTGYSGFGAIVGEIEVRDVTSADYNGIDGFAGHLQSGLGPDPTSSDYGLYGFQTVQDFSGLNDPSDKMFHGTFVAGIMASEYTSVSTGSNTLPFTGMAPLARYYGAVFDGGDSQQAFLSLNSSLSYMTTVAHTNVINNSWGATGTSAAYLNGSSYATSLLMDEYVGYSGKKAGTAGTYNNVLMVISAGNNGGSGDASDGLLSFPADSYNGLVVGALDAVSGTAGGLDDPTRSPALKVASYSSWRPLADGRSGVDVVAPGTNLWSTLAIDYTGTNGLIAGAASGTSFAAPHVAGLAALLYGAASNSAVVGDSASGYSVVSYGGMLTQKGTAVSTDHKLIKALIINSATKIAGLDANGVQQSTWEPGKVEMTEVTTSGSTYLVPNAVVPLNYAVGAGSADAMEAVLQYAEDANRFWDMSALRVVGSDQYYTLGQGKFVANSAEQVFLVGLTATLVWDRHVDFTVNTDTSSASAGEVTKDLLSNLDLILQKEVAPGVWQDVYMSAGTLDNVEHIYFQPVVTATDANATYRLDVHATTLADPDDTEGETYALVVSFQTATAVPEPVVWVCFVTGALGIVALRAWRRKS